MSKRSKRKNRSQAKARQANMQTAIAEKAYVGGGYYGYGLNSYSGRQYRADEYSVSVAYTFNVAINRSVEFWEQWLNGLKWEIRSSADDSVLLRSDKRTIAEGKGAKFARAIRHHKRAYKHSYFSSLAFSDTLYGESYTHFLCNDWGMAQLLEWVNPLGIEPNIVMGQIRDYRYSAAEGYQTLTTKEVAYRIAKRDAQNDLRGLSRVLAVIDSLNIEAAEKESLKAWFKNNMQLGGVISPSDATVSLSPGQVQQMEDKLRQDNKGAINAGRWAIAPANMTITPFPSPDIEKNFTLIKPLRDEILMAMGVYPQLAGDPSAADYDSAYDIKRQWWELLGIPYAHDIEDYINDQILPILEPYSGCYFVFVLTPYEVEKPEVVAQDFGAGYIDMFAAAQLRGYEGDNDLKGIYMINNVPMSKKIIIELANRPPSQYALDYANAATAGQAPNVNADTSLGISRPIASDKPLPDGWTEEDAVGNEAAIEAALNKEVLSQHSKGEIIPHYLTSKVAQKNESAYAYIPLPNQSDVLAVQRELRKLFTDERIEWQLPPTFHVTMCYAGVASNEAIPKMVNLINPEKMELQPVQGNGLDVFKTPDGQALHIRLFRNSVVDAIQADVYSAFGTEAYDISEFSKPESWNPHITLAYIPDGISINLAELNSTFDWLDSVVIRSDEVIIGRDNYEPVVVLTAPNYKSHEHHDHPPHILETSDIDPLDELQAWRNKYVPQFEELDAWRKFLINGKQQKREFVPAYLEQRVYSWIQRAIHIGDKQGVLDEFKQAYENVILNNLADPFEQKALRGDIGDTIQKAIESKDKQAILDAFQVARGLIETRVKAIQATRLDFENSVADIMSKALASNNYGRQQWATAMRKIIRSACTRAYVDGLVNGGVLDGKLSEDDQDTLASHIANQSQYVTNLGDEIFKTENGISEAMADRKPSLWFSKSVMPMYDAGQLSANGNRMMEFAGDDGDENCPTCKRLKGQRHRHKDWARKGLRPDAVEDSDNFDCGLWECKHHLIPVSAGEQGSW